MIDKIMPFVFIGLGIECIAYIVFIIYLIT
jgi:hypothetical protein